MRSHQNVSRQGWLPFADVVDGWLATGARLRLHAQAAASRALRLLPPVSFVAGPAHPSRVVVEGPLMKLLHYPARGTERRGPLVVVASLINRYYVLDLLPELSVLDGYCARGFDVHVLDWKAPGDHGPERGFDDYLDGAIAEAVARAGAGGPVAVLGYCMGGTLAAMFAARHPKAIRALTLLGTPIDFHASGRLAEWTRPHLFDADLVIDALGNLPPALMQSGFKLLNPADALFKMMRLHQIADDEAAVRQFVALESWLEDNRAFPGGLYRQYIRQLYQENALYRGTMRVAGTLVDLAAISAPLLNVVALRDHICAPPSSRALMDRVSSTEKRLLEFETGHIGLTTSRRAHAELWPKIFDWTIAACEGGGKR